MKRGNFVRSSESLAVAGRARGGRRMGSWSAVFAGAAFAIALGGVAQDGHPVAQNSAAAAVISPPENQAKPTKQQKATAADSERRKQISADSTQLLAMAVALKAEVDKTNKDVLSLNVIRKADQIEKMARAVKERMRQSGGPS